MSWLPTSSLSFLSCFALESQKIQLFVISKNCVLRESDDFKIKQMSDLNDSRTDPQVTTVPQETQEAQDKMA